MRPITSCSKQAYFQVYLVPPITGHCQPQVLPTARPADFFGGMPVDHEKVVVLLNNQTCEQSDMPPVERQL